MPAVWMPVSWLKTLWPMMGSAAPTGRPLHLLDLPPQRPQHVVAEARDGDPVELLQDHDRGVQGRVARALADAVHGAGGDGGAVVERAHRVVGPEAEVVVEVDDQRLVGERGHELRDVVVDAFGGEEAHGVGKGVARAPRGVAGRGQLDEVVRRRPGSRPRPRTRPPRPRGSARGRWPRWPSGRWPRGRRRPAGPATPRPRRPSSWSRVLPILYFRWRSEPEVKMKKLTSEGFAPIFFRMSTVRSMSRALERHMTTISRSARSRPFRLPSRISSSARRSEGAAEGKPTSRCGRRRRRAGTRARTSAPG